MKKSCMKKRSMPQRCLTVVLTLCLLLSCLPGAFAKYYPASDSGSCGPDARYEIVDGVLTISGSGPVTHPMDYFESLVHTVIIEEGITALELDRTFVQYPPTAGGTPMQIRDVTIPNSVRFIGRDSFAGTPWLDGQTEEFFIVGDGILLDYNGDGGDVVIPDTVRSIAGGVFYDNEAITSVTIGSNVEEIGDLAFDGCANLERAVINAPVIGDSAFADCGKLEDVTLTDAVTSISGSSFRGTPWLEGQADEFVILGDGILLGYNGPGGVVVIPETVRVILSHSLWFTGTDRRITEITIPATVVEIQKSAFEGGGFDGKSPPVVIHGEPGSAAEAYALSIGRDNSFRFVPFGQEDGSLYNFLNFNDFSEYRFSDVKKDHWFYNDVAMACNVGLMKGKTYNDFVPAGDIKLSEAITVAARVRDTYYYEQTDFTAASGTMWYQPYVDYALEHQIVAENLVDLNRPATRAEFAALLAAALPERELEAIHDEISFRDLDEEHPAYDAIMLLAQAGVMEGKGEGRFDPDAQVKRCEAAAMLARCVRPDLRIQAEVTPE